MTPDFLMMVIKHPQQMVLLHVIFLESKSFPAPQQAQHPIRDFVKNFGAGALATTQSALKSLPDMANLTPSGWQNALLYKQGERPVDRFDPYKRMGTTEQPFSLNPFW